MERLLRDGVITGFRAQVAPVAAGLGTSAYIALKIEQNTWREVSAELARVRYIEHAALLGGDHDVLALVRAPDNAALRDVVLGRVQSIAGGALHPDVAGLRGVRRLAESLGLGGTSGAMAAAPAPFGPTVGLDLKPT